LLTEIAAARAYDQAALRYRGTKAQLNFPETDYPPELKQEGERRVASGALLDVEDPVIAQKRKELLGALRAERAQAKRQKVSAPGGAKKPGRRSAGASAQPGGGECAGGGGLAQPDGGGFQGGWQQQGAQGMGLEAGGGEGMRAEVVNSGEEMLPALVLRTPIASHRSHGGW
jgi:hypothetical protein